MTFRVDLDIFRGPMDLLLYLVRKHEVEVVDIPIAPITRQYMDYLEVLQVLDVNAAGDFLEMASTLAEIKSRMLLPRGGEVEEELEDPRQDLVRQLLEYKKYKDAASMLEERGRGWQERFPRLAPDVDTPTRDLADEPIHELELWDLVSAFGRVLREQRSLKPASIVYDDTPIHVFMERIHGELVAHGRLALTELFQAGMHKSTLVGIFIAVLELVRHHGVRTEQQETFGEIWILPGESPSQSLDFAPSDSVDEQPSQSGQ